MRLNNATKYIFRKTKISDEAASSLANDEPTIMTLAEVDDISDAQYYNREIDDCTFDSYDRVRSKHRQIESNIWDCIFWIDKLKTVCNSPRR